MNLFRECLVEEFAVGEIFLDLRWMVKSMSNLFLKVQ